MDFLLLNFLRKIEKKNHYKCSKFQSLKGLLDGDEIWPTLYSHGPFQIPLPTWIGGAQHKPQPHPLRALGRMVLKIGWFNTYYRLINIGYIVDLWRKGQGHLTIKPMVIIIHLIRNKSSKYWDTNTPFTGIPSVVYKYLPPWSIHSPQRTTSFNWSLCNKWQFGSF